MKKYNGTTWVDTTLRQYKTATANIEPTIYTDGTAITSYTIKGNSVQAGTPTPSNPIPVEGVGELDSGQYKIPISSGGVTTDIDLGSTQTVRQIYQYVCTGDENWTNYFGASLFMVQGIFNLAPFIPQVDSLSTHYTYKPIQSGLDAGLSHGQYALQRSGTPQQYGYNIALKNTDYTDTTNFKAYLQAQYAAGTPVTVWYVLATAETAAVNEPLMKIGDYADTLSNATAIPTTEGANSITVDTSVQPSEFTATWTGWHNASVKEYDGSQWNE